MSRWILFGRHDKTRTTIPHRLLLIIEISIGEYVWCESKNVPHLDLYNTNKWIDIFGIWIEIELHAECKPKKIEFETISRKTHRDKYQRNSTTFFFHHTHFNVIYSLISLLGEIEWAWNTMSVIQPDCPKRMIWVSWELSKIVNSFN